MLQFIIGTIAIIIIIAYLLHINPSEKNNANLNTEKKLKKQTVDFNDLLSEIDLKYLTKHKIDRNLTEYQNRELLNKNYWATKTKEDYCNLQVHPVLEVIDVHISKTIITKYKYNEKEVTISVYFDKEYENDKEFIFKILNKGDKISVDGLFSISLDSEYGGMSITYIIKAVKIEII